MRAMILLLALGVFVAGSFDAAATPERQASLRLVDVAPVTFRGSAFAPQELVRVTLTRQRKRLVRNARATARGVFEVRFGLVAIDVCRSAVTVVAAGDRGSRATYRRDCRPVHPHR